MDKKAMYKLSYGLCVLTAKDSDRDNGCIINTAIQASLTPNRISVCVDKATCTHDMIMNSNEFTISIISQDVTFELFKHFGFQSGKNKDKFTDFTNCSRGANGIYYITEGTNAYISVKVSKSVDLGSHSMFVGEITDMEVLNDTPSATYEYYTNSIKPKPESVGTATDGQTIWRCTICGHEYYGEEVPEEYICPICNHTADYFEKVTDSEVKVEVKSKTIKVTEEISMSKWICPVCGNVYEGPEAPEECSVCHVKGATWTKMDGNNNLAAKHELGIYDKTTKNNSNVSDEDKKYIYDQLIANFHESCSEVGIYLCMARIAHREGYPEIGLYLEKVSQEKAEHAAKFAELLGEDLEPKIKVTTKDNLSWRVDFEYGTTQSKYNLAHCCKKYDLDALHDTIHEMARDDARFCKAFEGLIKRYFK